MLRKRGRFDFKPFNVLHKINHTYRIFLLKKER